MQILDELVGRKNEFYEVLDCFYLGKRRFYHCRCSCSNIFHTIKFRILKYKRLSCGCRNSIKPGDKFGRLSAIKPMKETRRKKRRWLFKCDCGKEVERYAWRTIHGTARGKTCSCGCYNAEMNSIDKRKKPGEAARNAIIQSYKKNAKKRNLEFCLSFDEIIELLSGNCHYCGIPPCREVKTQHGNGSFIYNGIDRKNNKEGYHKNNCVSCCTRCNSRKHESSYDDFLSWIEQIYLNTKENEYKKPTRFSSGESTYQCYH